VFVCSWLYNLDSLDESVEMPLVSHGSGLCVCVCMCVYV
jgi:hypothetical protein